MNFVFDFGGVLFDWHPPSLLRRELPERVHDEASAAHWVAEFFQAYQGDWGEFDRGTLDTPALVQRIATRTGLSSNEVQRVVDGVPHELQPKPDTVALLRRLHAAGHGVFYLSNMPLPYAQHLVRSHDFIALFARGVFSSHVHHNKPEAEIYRIAEQTFGAPPAELVFMDDHPPNVVAAQARGWKALHFRHAAQVEDEMRASGWLG